MNKKLIKNIFFPLVIAAAGLFAFLSVQGMASAVIVDQVIAVVNKAPITLYQFADFDRRAFKDYEQMQSQASQGVFTQDDSAIMTRTKQVLDVLIDKALIKQEEEKAAIYIPQKQLDGYVKAVALANNLTEPQFFAMLTKKGISRQEYMKQIREHFSELELLRKTYGNKMVIDNNTLLAYYRKNIEEFRGEPEINLKLIFLSVPAGASKAVKEKIYNRISEIRKEAADGNTSFSQLARKYSEDPSEKNGGRIGYVFRNKLSPEFSDVAFKLQVGDVSRIIRTPFGYAILKSIGKKEGSFKTFKQAKQQIFSILEKYKTQKYLKKLLKKARKNSYVKILIAV